MTGIMGAIFSLLGGPIVGAVMGVIRLYMEKKITEAQLEAELRLAIMDVMAKAHASQIDLLKAEIDSEDPWVRRWRPLVAMSFAFVLLWYALLVPIFVNWWGLPPLRVGDVLLKWIMDLLAMCLGAFAVGGTLETIAKVLRRK